MPYAFRIRSEPQKTFLALKVLEFGPVPLGVFVDGLLQHTGDGNAFQKRDELQELVLLGRKRTVLLSVQPISEWPI